MSNINQLQKDIARLNSEIKNFSNAARVLVENYTHSAFRDTKWDGKTWTKRKSKNKSDRKNPDKPRALMVQTRTLQRSIRVTNTNTTITIGSNVKYAQIHNEGGTINHPGGTAYLPFGQKHTARKTKGRIANMKDNQMIFIKKSQMAKFPQAKVTKPHKIPIPQRQFMGYSAQLIAQIEQSLNNQIQALNKKP